MKYTIVTGLTLSLSLSLCLCRCWRTAPDSECGDQGRGRHCVAITGWRSRWCMPTVAPLQLSYRSVYLQTISTTGSTLLLLLSAQLGPIKYPISLETLHQISS